MNNDFLVDGATYIEKDNDGLPTGSLFKYCGIVDQEHEFQCLEFDCQDVFQHYSTETSESQLSNWFHRNPS